MTSRTSLWGFCSLSSSLFSLSYKTHQTPFLTLSKPIAALLVFTHVFRTSRFRSNLLPRLLPGKSFVKIIRLFVVSERMFLKSEGCSPFGIVTTCVTYTAAQSCVKCNVSLSLFGFRIRILPVN